MIISTVLVVSFLTFPTGPLMAIDAAELVEESKDPVIREFDFSYSKDGKSVVYYRSVGRATPDLFVKHGKLAPVNISRSDDYWEIEPDMSPDGTEIVYSAGQSMADIGLRIMNADGSNDRELYDKEGNEGGAAWSPDGKRVLFWSINLAEKTSDILVLRKGGHTPLNLTEDLPGHASGGEWTADGTEIIYGYKATEDGPDEFYIMAADGSHKRQVTFGGERKFGAIVSPDGKWVVYCGPSANGSTDIFAQRLAGHAKGKSPVNLTNSADEHEFFISFTPDGSQLIFSHGNGKIGYHKGAMLTSVIQRAG
ncbi:MAG: hypothetical protein COB37_07105 [Kordiimonadales bacterium]|nr:MAG: hypothetical protein COB37_07105 [Kordiimonadales bacterium]